MKSVRAAPVALLFILSFSVASLYATEYFVAPPGTGSGSTCSSGSPCLFATAQALVAAGDYITLKNGTWTSGFIDITCPSNAANGTSGHPITIRAQNERQAFLDTAGAFAAISMIDCTYWNIEGLHAEGGDDAVNFHDVFEFNNVTHLNITRNILAYSNRYKNAHLIDFYAGTSSDITETENEFYYFHRHATLGKPVVNSTFTRNYCNSREYGGFPGSFEPFSTRGGACFSLYPSHDSVIQNNISEGQQKFSENNASGETACTDNTWLGNISFNDWLGMHLDARGNTEMTMPVNMTFDNNLTLGMINSEGLFARSAKNTVVSHHTSMNAVLENGIQADKGSNGDGDGTYTTFVDSSLLLTNDQYGALFTDQSSSLVEYSNGYMNGTANFSVPTQSMNTAINPVMGTCYAWIPDASPMKGAGKAGTDIGANILYKYESGVLTSDPLWDRTTGQFPHGAFVTGLNDSAGDSLYDVNDRLHINSHSCNFPASYTGRNGTGLLTMGVGR